MPVNPVLCGLWYSPYRLDGPSASGDRREKKQTARAACTCGCRIESSKRTRDLLGATRTQTLHPTCPTAKRDRRGWKQMARRHALASRTRQRDREAAYPRRIGRGAHRDGDRFPLRFHLSHLPACGSGIEGRKDEVAPPGTPVFERAARGSTETHT